MIEKYRVPKTTQTYADTLVAVGIADLFATLPGDGYSAREVQIVDQGDAYCLTVNPPVDPEKAKSARLMPDYPYIKFKKTDEAPAGVEVIDYEAEKEKGDRFKKFSQAVKSSGRKKSIPVEMEEMPREPHPDLQLLKDFNDLRGPSNSYNKLILSLLEKKSLAEAVVKKLTANETEQDKKLKVSNLQFFSPVSGKGVHRPKPDGTGPGSLSDRLVDWFDEWMKYRAMYKVMCSYKVGDDTKVLVLDPGEISLARLKEVRGDFVKIPLGGEALHLEIMAALSLAEILISKSDFFQGRQGLALLRRRPNQIIRGIKSVLFKKMSAFGKATMSVSFLGLPGWFPVLSREDAEAWLDILAEHKRCVRILINESISNEKISDPVPLLQGYRDFISSGSHWDFLSFSADYGTFIVRRLARNEWVEQFSIPNLRRLFMSYGLKEIIENEGFLNIARAIRRATVSAQFSKAKEKEKDGTMKFDIHYGLAQEWKRKVKYPEQFVVVLSDFVQQYNAENARHAELAAKKPEQYKERRKSITDRDLNEVIGLIDNEKYGSELVGMLLLAYGYAREESKVKEEE
ncbi:MAG: hypothetical protein ACOY30_02100 [Bacillota bacterium]